MKIFRRKQFVLLSAVFLVLGIVGTIGFFPFNFHSQYTCIYHHLFCDGMKNHVHSTAGANMSGVLNPDMGAHHTSLLNRYLVPFGFLWWGSIGLLISGIYLLKMNFPRSLREKKTGKLNKETA